VRCARGLHALALSIAVGASAVLAQDYPNRPIRLVVPALAGEGPDKAGRNLAARLGQRLGQQVIVDNRPGASGAIGAEFAARGAPDGYTLLLGSTPELALHPALVSKPPYLVLRDFVPVALVSDIAFMLVVHPSLPARSLDELVQLARKRPGQIRYGSEGRGTTSHLTVALICDLTGADMVHVPYNGTPPAAADLLGGSLQALMPPLPSVLPYTRDGRLRALAVSSGKRWPTAAGVPTVAEAGLPGYEMVLWTGVLAPVNTPADIVQRLYREIAQVLAQPEVVQAFADQGAGRQPNLTPQRSATWAEKVARPYKEPLSTTTQSWFCRPQPYWARRQILFEVR
jgi:tripartite-type tricarboxylate transporter receptor subunit TctC